MDTIVANSGERGKASPAGSEGRRGLIAVEGAMYEKGEMAEAVGSFEG